MRTKIESVETILWDKWLILKIICEDGTIGIGEGGVHGWQKPTKTAIDTMGEYLIGKDPYLIEHHYQFLYRSSHFMGSVIQGALSAIDIASASGTINGAQSVIPETTGGFTLGAVFTAKDGTVIGANGSVTVFDDAVYYIADTAYANEVSPFWSAGTITEITVALGQFNVVGSVAITGSGSVEVIDATSHAVLNLGGTVTLNA